MRPRTEIEHAIMVWADTFYRQWRDKHTKALKGESEKLIEYTKGKKLAAQAFLSQIRHLLGEPDKDSINKPWPVATCSMCKETWSIEPYRYKTRMRRAGGRIYCGHSCAAKARELAKHT